MDNNDFLEEEQFTQEQDDLSGTQELDSLSALQSNRDIDSDIMPRDMFTEINSTEDDNEKTRLMDSVQPDTDAPVAEDFSAAANPVKKRRKKKKKKNHLNHTRTLGLIFLGVILSF